ncbi:methylenetetrahydrofolate reductase, partial [Puniceibacterium confluentis]
MTRPEISFEFFPPKNIEATFRLWDTVQVLAPLAPRFVSVTYGAGGTTRDLTRDVVSTLHKHSGLRTAAHLTCVDATRAETLQIARDFADAGVTDIVALRGDPPKGANGFVPHPEGFHNSVELIESLKATGDFTIRVGAYPDKHPEAPTATADVEYLKRKLDAGADEALTQFFFEAETFFRFRDACVKAGIDKPIVPGIFPIENWKGARRFAEACGTHIPAWVIDAFETATRDGRQDLLATAMCT